MLNRNGLRYSLDCINSLRNITYPNFEIVIVDNGSTDGSREVLEKKCSEFKLIANDSNLGFPEGNNVGISWALNNGYDYVLLLNNDTTVEPNFLDELIRVAENEPSTGIVGPQIVFYAKPSDYWSIGGYISKWNGRPFHLKNLPKEGKKDSLKTREVDWVSGCALLAKSTVIRKIGLLDTDYFFGTEDVDWCVRARKHNFKILYTHSSIVNHKKPKTALIKKYSYVHHYYTVRNLLIFMKKNSSFTLGFWLSFSYSLLKRILWSSVTLDFKSVMAIIKAIIDFRANRVGMTYNLT